MSFDTTNKSYSNDRLNIANLSLDMGMGVESVADSFTHGGDEQGNALRAWRREAG